MICAAFSIYIQFLKKIFKGKRKRHQTQGVLQGILLISKGQIIVILLKLLQSVTEGKLQNYFYEANITLILKCVEDWIQK